jgi:hypothetical protein
MVVTVNCIWMWCDSNFFVCVCFNSHQEAEYPGVSVRVAAGCEHARQTWGESLHLWSFSFWLRNPSGFYSLYALGRQFNGASLDPIQTASILLKFSEQFDTSWLIAVIAVFRCLGSCKESARFWKPFATFYNMLVFGAFFTKRNRSPYLQAMSDWLTDWLTAT